MQWIRGVLGVDPAAPMQDSHDQVVAEFNAEMAKIKAAGSLDGQHYTNYVEQVKELKREKRHQEAIALLERLVESTEAESKSASFILGVAPWYYEQLAIIFRKEGRLADEITILERYAAQPKAPGVGPSRLSERLATARRRAKP